MLTAPLCWLFVAVTCQEPAQQPAPPDPAVQSVEPSHALADRWLAADRSDGDPLAAAVRELMRTPEPSLAWVGRRLAEAAKTPLEPQSVAVERLATQVMLAFIDQKRKSGMVHRGQYAALEALQPFASRRLFELILQTPNWYFENRRAELIAPLVDLQPHAPDPAILAGLIDIIRDADGEMEDLRFGLACLAWHWGRREFVEKRVEELRRASTEGEAEDRFLALRNLSDIWYRVGEYERARVEHTSLTTMADRSGMRLSPTDWYWAACYNALSKHVDKGLDALDRCAQLQASDSVDESTKLPRTLFEKDPEIAPLRASPRFAEILARAFPQRPEQGRGR